MWKVDHISWAQSSISPILKLYIKTSYKSGCHIQERGYCNSSKPCRGVPICPHEAQDQRPYPWPRISVNSCPQPFAYPHPAMRGRPKMDRCNGDRQLHLIATLSNRPIGGSSLCYLACRYIYISMWLVRKVLKSHSHDASVLNQFKQV